MEGQQRQLGVASLAGEARLRAFGDVAVAAVDVAMVLMAIEAKWSRQPRRMVTGRGQARGHRPGREPGALARLPRSSASALEDVEKVEHRKALDYGEMAVFMADR